MSKWIDVLGRAERKHGGAAGGWRKGTKGVNRSKGSGAGSRSGGVTKTCVLCRRCLNEARFSGSEWPKALQRRCLECSAASGGQLPSAATLMSGTTFTDVLPAEADTRGRGRSKTPGGHMTSQHRGVHWYSWRRKWRAEIQVTGTKHHIGYFDHESDAARAYDAAAILYHGPRAKVNFPRMVVPVSVLLFTVTFYANLAHSLTRSP